jgi:aminomethyltransferase
MEAGRPYNIAPTGPSDIRRIEAGILNHGVDIMLEDTPYHVGLEWLVNLDQEADFIGKDALRRIRAEGVSRKLAGVEIAGDPLDLNMTRWPVHARGTQVGAVTSAVYSPRLEKNIGYAMVPTDSAELGTALTIDTPAGERAATVVAKPFVDPTKETPKS